MAKHTKVTLETDSLLILHNRGPLRAWCSQCAREVDLIAMNDAEVVSNLDRLELEQWLNSEELHRSHKSDGSALLCLPSLLARVQKTIVR